MKPLMKFPRFGFLTAAVCLILLCPIAKGQLQTVAPRMVELEDLGIVRPQGITYHPERDSLFILTRDEIFELSRAGAVLNSFSIADWTERGEGIVFDPFSNSLLVCNGGRRIFHFDPEGSLIGAGLFVTLESDVDASGLALDPVSGNLWAADDEGEKIWEFDRQGRPVGNWPTKLIVPSFREPQGLGFFGDDLLVADDGGGSHSIYLVSRAGNLVQFIFDACDYDLQDPEGITSLGESGICLIGDLDSRMLCLDTAGTALPQNLVSAPAQLGIEGTFVGVAVTNPLASVNQVMIAGRDALGSAVLQAPVVRQVAEQGQTAFLTLELPGLQDAQVLDLHGEQGPIQGFFMAGDFDLDRLDGIGGQPEASTRLWFPLVRQTGAEQTLLVLINQNGQQSAEAQLEVVDASGQVIRTTQVHLAAAGSFQGSLADLLGEGFEIEDAFARLSASQPLQGLAVQQSDTSLTALPALLQGEVQNLWSPHFFFGEQTGSTELRVLNREDQPLEVQATAYLDNGEVISSEFTVAAQGLFAAPLEEMFAAGVEGLTQGFLQLVPQVQPPADEPAQADFAAALTVSNLGGGSKASLAMFAQGWKQAAFQHISNTPSEGNFQGLAIVNPDSQERARIKVRAYSQQGALKRTVEFNIDALHRFIGLLNDENLFGADFEQAGGYLKVTSSRPVVSVTIFGGPAYLATIQGQKAFP